MAHTFRNGSLTFLLPIWSESQHNSGHLRRVNILHFLISSCNTYTALDAKTKTAVGQTDRVTSHPSTCRISQGRFTAIATLILAPDFRWKSDRIGPYISRFRGRIIACWTYASRVEVMPLGGGAALHAAARYM